MVSIRHATLTGPVDEPQWNEEHVVPLATQAEAQAGLASDKLMTPQRTAQAMAALRGEVEAARGDRSQLGLRISTIANFASPNAGGIVTGNFYDNSFHGGGSATLAGVANRLDLAPFFTSVPLRIDQIGVAVSTAVAGALGRVCIYTANADGWPDELVFEGASNLDFSTTGYKAHSLDLRLDSGRIYWLGGLQSSTATLRTISTVSAVNLGLQSSSSTQYFTVVRRTHTFADPLPASFGFVPSGLTANITPPSIRFRAAAL